MEPNTTTEHKGIVLAMIFAMGMIVSMVVALSQWGATHRGASTEDTVRHALSKITYDEVAPYLEGLGTTHGGKPMYCEGRDNLNLLPAMDFYREAVARFALNRFLDAEYLDSKYMDVLPPEGESSWGLYSKPALKAEMLPFIESAKTDPDLIAALTEVLRKQEVAGRRPAVKKQ